MFAALIEILPSKYFHVTENSNVFRLIINQNSSYERKVIEIDMVFKHNVCPE